MTGLTPILSVVIPTFNRADKLRRALQSLKEQTVSDFEVLVCDDGSTDATADVVAEFSGSLRIRYLWENNSGSPARPRNRGIREAVGEWVCFLDADDWWYPEKLARVYSKTQYFDVVYHACHVCTPNGQQLGVKKSRQLLPPAFTDLMISGNALITSSVCVRRDLLIQCGGFDEVNALVPVEDYDLWLRLASMTERFYYICEPLGAYWSNGEGISGFSERYIQQEQSLFNRYKHLLHVKERHEAECVLAYKIGIARKALLQYSECRQYFIAAMKSRQPRIFLYSLFYYLLALLHCPYIIR